MGVEPGDDKDRANYEGELVAGANVEREGK
jgi:hypothetical protein